jgi:SAM-dependent methyltransferase
MACNLCHHDAAETLPFYYLWHGKRFQGKRCRRCRLVWIDPQPTAAELAALYDTDYFADGLHGLDRLDRDYESWADGTQGAARDFLRREIRARHPQARSLYEIGAAMGHFLAAAAAEGFATGGIEFSPAAVAKARHKFGLDIACGNVETADLSAQAGAWDVVYAGDLFEHLRDPAATVDRIAALLAPDGLVVIRVPSTFNLIATRLALPLLQLTGREQRLPDNPYHLFEYDPATLGAMLRRRFDRVEVVQDATPPRRLNRKHGSLGYWLKSAAQLVNYPLTRATGRWGDRLTAYARTVRSRELS